MQTAICTLFEGDYHYGVGVLVNSLYQHGFKGIIWAGCRTPQLPGWATPLIQVQDYHEFKVADDCVIRFIAIDPPMHLANYKPSFMENLLARCPEIEALFYFDPDIVNKCRWSFYEWWVSQGVALCGDHWYSVPANDPKRLAWKRFAEDHGFTCQRQLEHHFNSGFIGISHMSRSLLILWQKLITIAAQAGHLKLDNIEDHETSQNYPYLYQDQTVLNLALMLSLDPLSTVAPDGMDFTFSGTIMSHAIGPQIKPWRKKILRSALRGVPPSRTDKLFWQHTQIPIQVYAPQIVRWKRLKLLMGVAIGRFMRRN
jgi:hypothetical protein